MENKVTGIPISQIKCVNNRKVTKTQINEMVNSIKAVGLISPLMLKLIDNDDYVYEVIAGRVRFQALLKLKIQNLDKDLFIITDKSETELIAYEENRTRTNMTLYEELQHLEALRVKYGDIKQLAEVMHSSVRAINTRLSLFKLNSEWMKLIKKDDLGNFTIPMLKIVSDLNDEGQLMLLNVAGNIEDAKDLKEYLMRKIIGIIDKAEWHDDEGNWYKSCEDCEHNSKNTEFLFDEFKEESGVCGDMQCWEQKEAAYIKYKLSKYLKSDYGNYHVIYSGMDANSLAKLKSDIKSAGFINKNIKFHDYYNTTIYDEINDITEESNTETAFFIVPSYYNSTSGIVYIPEEQENFADGTENEGTEIAKIESLEQSFASKQERHNKKRERHAIEDLMVSLHYKADEGMCTFRFPDDEELFTLINMFGVSSSCITSFGHEKLYTYLSTKTDEDVCDLSNLSKWGEYVKVVDPILQRQLIWEDLTQRIIKYLEHGQKGGVSPRWEESKVISCIIKFDLLAAYDRAVEELPDPKSWQATINNIKKHDAVEIITKNGIKIVGTNFLIPCTVLDAFNIKIKSSMRKTFIGYKAGDKQINTVSVTEKIKYRILKSICKITLKPIEEIKVSAISDDEINYTISVCKDSGDFFETWEAASDYYIDEENKKEEK